MCLGLRYLLLKLLKLSKRRVDTILLIVVGRYVAIRLEYTLSGLGNSEPKLHEIYERYPSIIQPMSRANMLFQHDHFRLVAVRTERLVFEFLAEGQTCDLGWYAGYVFDDFFSIAVVQ